MTRRAKTTRPARSARRRGTAGPDSTRPAKRRAAPQRLSTSASFREFVLDQLSDVDALSDRAMFGGLGLYAGDVFFALVAADVLYFKVDDATRAMYESAGCGPFRPYGGEAMSSYYNVPVDVLEHAPTLTVWARRAIDVARAAARPRRRGR